MKTKLTLFVTVLATALFGVGCASTPEGPPLSNAIKWNGHWYACFTVPLTWDAAMKQCEELGGHLVIIDNEKENVFLFNLALQADKYVQHVWIGCQGRPVPSATRWVNGEVVKNGYSSWRPEREKSSPRAYKGSLDFRPPYPENFWWDVGTSEDKFSYICEWE